MKIKLNIQDRYILISVLPETGNFETMSAIDSLTKKLYPTQEEVKKYNIKQEGSRVTWDPDANKEVEFEFTDNELSVIISNFKKLSDENKLSLQQFVTYKKFTE